MSTSIEDQGQDQEKMTRWESFVWYLVSRFNPLARELAWRASTVCAVNDAGVFFYPRAYPWYGMLRERSPGGSGSFTLRIGRAELVVDYRAPSRGEKRAPLPHWSENPWS